MMIATIIFGGMAIFLQKPLVPAYWLKNQDELGQHEMSITKCTDIIDVGKVNANAFRRDGNQMKYYLFILPKEYLAYDLADQEPSPANRSLKINMRRLENVTWKVGPKDTDFEYTVWWGHFLFGVNAVDSSRKMIVEKEEEEEDLMTAFSRGMTL